MDLIKVPDDVLDMAIEIKEKENDGEVGFEMGGEIENRLNSMESKINRFQRILNRTSETVREIEVGAMKELLKDEIVSGELKLFLREQIKNFFSEYIYATELMPKLNELLKREIQIEIKNTDISKAIRLWALDSFKDNVDKVIREVLPAYITALNNRLSKDYERTKILCYSIESEIKHTLMRTPISISTEEMIKSRLDKILEVSMLKAGFPLLVQTKNKGGD